MPLAAYCYLRVVGRGSYGEVTLVRHRRDGRQYLHEKHILHRDLKTQNVFLTRTNIIKVGDLGIARVLENNGDMANTLIGTPYYMSPELFSNKPYNYKSDVWALGCCVYEMATLKHAFNAKDMNSLVYRIIEGKLPPMPKDYSPELSELIRTMLSKRPEERPSVRSILRQPYIKHQISLFLEATKAKTSKSNIKSSDSKSKPVATVVSGNAESSHKVVPLQPQSSEGSKTYVMGEDKCLSQEKPIVIDPLKTPASLKGHNCKPDVSDTSESLATISKVNIDILPAERRDSLSDGLVRENQPRHLDTSNELEGKCSISQVKEKLQDGTEPSAQPRNVIPAWFSNDVTGERSDPARPLQPLNKDQKPKDQDQVANECVTEKPDRTLSGLQPHSFGSEPSLSRQRRQKKREQPKHSGEERQEAPPRLLPSLPTAGKKDVTLTQKDAENQSRLVIGSAVSSLRSKEVSSSKDRPLSARERRRLKQSQEEMFPSGPSVRRSLSASGPGNSQEEGQPTPALWSSDCSVAQERKLIRCLSEDELSSSTSSTDKSDGDSKERKCHTNEMSDLVQLMTQTLKLESKESCEDLLVPDPVSEFKLHRKYRDTLILHGKVVEEAEDLHFKQLPSAVMPGSEKIRRIVEVLRADVIQGLGIQLLEQVYDLLEEEDELQRETFSFSCVPGAMSGAGDIVTKIMKRWSKVFINQKPAELEVNYKENKIYTQLC
ncbi:serine/threonine-protein kinase Nek4 isoform X7 [Canis lupus familiaris]|uniref:serine/threonine-protein kinase Nek4 isoform X7 n=1 Tax=Canis lupus familiaris TaxID=9615 RepID=UPI000BAA3536|nr:serine/threonine-protein kinase Nek4 isoform X7 [Canis lupus familiaris]XP_025311919.1 serine/threonine-protein kinase Nek4 isoform X8 [Canis lupus dingo]|eukprot:XP_022262331.1 serine/threonine-protein kinase Nek4 isoform X6 [Canis lupus familiaris]